MNSKELHSLDIIEKKNAILKVISVGMQELVMGLKRSESTEDVEQLKRIIKEVLSSAYDLQDYINIHKV